MFYCENCEKEFIPTETKRENVFIHNLELNLPVCPECGEVLIQDTMQCEICEKWLPEDELHDTTEYINGGCGYCCESCIEDADMKAI